MQTSSKIAGALAALALTFAGFSSPALARDSFVMDGAGMFSTATVYALNSKISAFNQATGKEVLVVTVPSLNGTPLNDATEHTFAEKQVNGVLIFIAKADKKFNVVGDRASRAFFPPGTFSTIHDAMRSSFQTGDFDGGITTGVNLVLDQYRSHQSGLRPAGALQQQRAPATTSNQSFGGSMSLIWLGVILLIGFLVIRAIFRALFARRSPPGYGPGQGSGQPPMMGGPGYGAGMGAGYGSGMGGGGSFFSGLLGGLGGAFLGNELFRGGQSFGGGTGMAGMGVDPGAAQDASGWQSDAGQADMGNAGGGGWGDSGGGFDAGGGGGFDGGGGDGGGGW